MEFMLYRPFGKTGINISALGFGAMRLPTRTDGDKQIFDEEASIAIIRQGIDAGVNYLDTAPYYCDAQSEGILGKALANGYREKVYLSTKLPGDAKGYDAARQRLETSLERMKTDHIDFYHLWGISLKRFETEIRPDGQLQMVLDAKSEGLIRHLSFSFHDEAQNMIKLIDTGLFASVLCQYNLLDRTNEEAIAYAAQKGMGVVVMGPVGGGRLGAPSPVVQALLPGKRVSSPELALRFVLANPHVSCALSGMGSSAMVEENVRVASNDADLSETEKALIDKSVDENAERAKLYCTGCNYCMPCPFEVNIPCIFDLMNDHRIYQLTDYARAQYKMIGVSPWMKGQKADACTQCGVSEEKCPQHIKIRDQLKESLQALS